MEVYCMSDNNLKKRSLKYIITTTLIFWPFKTESAHPWIEVSVNAKFEVIQKELSRYCKGCGVCCLSWSCHDLTFDLWQPKCWKWKPFTGQQDMMKTLFRYDKESMCKIEDTVQKLYCGAVINNWNHCVVIACSLVPDSVLVCFLLPLLQDVNTAKFPIKLLSFTGFLLILVRQQNKFEIVTNLSPMSCSSRLAAHRRGTSSALF